MEQITIDKDVLRKMLLEAYESGWYGTIELKEETVDEILEKINARGGNTYQISDIPLNINITPQSFDIPIPVSIDLNFNDVRIIEDTIQIDRDVWQNVGDG
jgi:hypothetical protein